MDISEQELKEAMRVNVVRAKMRCRNRADDLISAGNLGIVQAMKNFDRSRGVKFSTYARPYITRNQNREFTDICKGVHLPHRIADYPGRAAEFGGTIAIE